MANPAGVGRPREFELGDAVRDAMDVFWDRGYEGASLPDLMAGTGLSRGSLYKAFGDKKALLLAALDLYMADGLKATADILSQPGPVKDAIRDSLLRYAHLSIGEAGRRGCLVVAMTTELAAHDADVAERTGRMFRRLQQLYAGAIVRGQARLIDATAAEDLDRVRKLLDELEEAQEIAQLLESARDAPGCRIFIGAENRMFALSGSSVIAAPYRGSQGEVVGVVGVIGPTRLNYARVVPMVDFTAKALTRLMA